MKIAFQHVVTKDIPDINADIMWKNLESYFEIVCPNVEIEQKWIDKSTYVLLNDYVQFYNNIDIIASIVKAEKEGFDAVIVGCFTDCAVLEARSAVDIPVIGIAESIYAFASIIGNYFGVVVPLKGFIPGMDKTAIYYGQKQRLIPNQPFRSWNMKVWDEVEGQFSFASDSCIAKFDSVAQKLVEDGAHLIINGCAWTGPAFTMAKYFEVKERGIPILDPVAIGLKMAVAMAELKNSIGLQKSRKTYVPIPIMYLDKLRETYSAIS